MSFKITMLTPMLETKDLKGTIKFYTDTLGFTCNNFLEEWGWAHLSKDSISIMFMTPNEHRNIPEPVMSGSLYLLPDDVDKAWNELKDKCKICFPIQDFEYGMREFSIYDNNGYELQFGQEINKNN